LTSNQQPVTSNEKPATSNEKGGFKMIGSLYSGISGLKANTDAMSVIGDNIANVNTTGFKSSRASFADVLSGVTGNEIGQGVMMTGQNADWTQGAPESTGNATDLAITGDGLFVVQDSSGMEYYTRAGNFQFDNVGNLVTHDGMIVQGYKIDSATGVLGAVSNITIESGNCSPLVTSEMTVNLNLNADDTNGLDESVGSTLTVDCINPDSDIIFTAVNGGTSGNDISIEYIDSGAAGLSVSVSEDAITVNLGGAVVTSADIAAAINADIDASLLVTAMAEGDGDGEITAIVHAALTVAGGNADSDITFTAVNGGTAGNDISIEYIDSLAGGLSVSVSGDVITVDLGGAAATADQVITAIDANADAARLVTAVEANGDGAGNVTAPTVSADLSGGKGTSIHAALTVDCTNANSDITFTAVNGGTAGNDISIEYIDSLAGGLSVSVSGDVITVDLGGAAATADQVITAIDADADAARLVTADVANGDGTGAVEFKVPAALSGGIDDIPKEMSNLSGGGGGAELTVDCTNANSDITFTAVNEGTAGNNISIEYVDPGAVNQALGIVVDDSNSDDIIITVNLATDAAGAITSTASGIATAINTNADAALLVSASAEGKGIVEAKVVDNLAGGVEVPDNTPDIYSNTITAYDSKGSAVDVTVQYTCVGHGRWVWDANPSDGSSSSTGVISFDEKGKLSYPAANPTITITGLSNGAEDLEIEWNLVGNNNFTGYALLSSTSSQIQNGYAAGTLQSVSVDDEGFVVKAYSNGHLIPGYRIALADFSSYAGLARTGDNLYSESRVSGQPTFGIPGNGGLGGINSRSLEMSNVDLATEFVRMITTQRAFQANSRVITTSDEILQELINLKR
jgi:flagellar hook protein FlgE